MTKGQKLKYFLSHPFAVIKSGLKANEEYWHSQVIRKNYGFSQLPTIDLLDFIPDFGGEVKNYTYLKGTSTVPDILLLKLLATKIENCKYFEIGSWRGESISNMSQVCSSCTSLTLGADDMKKLGMSQKVADIHGTFSKGKENIKTIFHNSHTFDFTSLDEKFDLVFIDGDHSYAGVRSDTSKVFELTKGAAVIVWHDYGWNTEDVRYNVLHAILDGLPNEEHKHLYHVSNTLCCVYLKDWNFSKSFTKFPTKPNKKFSVRIQAEKI
jgi:hypothetical protein